MENKVNLREIAEYCVNTYKNDHTKENMNYVDTLFIAIYEDNSIEFSYTPHILTNAQKVILIHCHSALATTNWYMWYRAECINQNGAVSKNLDERFSIETASWGSYSNQRLELVMDHYIIKTFGLPLDNGRKLNAFWNLYLSASKCETLAEANMLVKLTNACEDNEALKDEIKELKYSEAYLKTQLAKYETLLDEIKDLVKIGK